MADSLNEYMSRISHVAMIHCRAGGLYEGVEGAKRLARECAPALLDFPNGEREMGSTYSGICVIAYWLKPPIDAKTWMTEMRAALEKYKAERVITPMPENYKPAPMATHLNEIEHKKAMWRGEALWDG